MPPSPEDTIHADLDTDSDMGDMHSSLHLPEAPSEPSSPASYTSMPSYVASLSSISRTSSPAPLDYGHHARGAASEELVLPTLSLPSSSLHLSLRKWEGEGRGVRIVLLSNEDKRLMRALGEREELVDMGRRGEVGVLREDKIVATLITGLDEDQVSICFRPS
jgi:hypothetical protein